MHGTRNLNKKTLSFDMHLFRCRERHGGLGGTCKLYLQHDRSDTFVHQFGLSGVLQTTLPSYELSIQAQSTDDFCHGWPGKKKKKRVSKHIIDRERETLSLLARVDLCCKTLFRIGFKGGHGMCCSTCFQNRSTIGGLSSRTSTAHRSLGCRWYRIEVQVACCPKKVHGRFWKST